MRASAKTSDRPSQGIPWGLVKRALGLLRKNPAWLLAATLSAMIASALGLAGPYFLRELTNRAISGTDRSFAWWVAASFGVAGVRAGANYLKSVSVARTSSWAVRDLRDLVARHIQRLPYPSIGRYRSGDLVSRINDDLSKTESLFARVPDYFHQPLQLVGGLAFMLALSPRLTVATCALMPVAVLIFERVLRPMQRDSHGEMESLASVSGLIQDGLRGAAMVRAFNLQMTLAARLRPLVDAVARFGLRRKKREILSFIPFLVLRYIPQLVVPLYGGYLAFRGQIAIGDMLAFDWLIWMVFGPLEAFLDWIRELRETTPALTRTFEILDAPTERSGGCDMSGDPPKVAIRFDRVEYSYDPAAVVLGRLDLTVRTGERVALVGPSGCGKTTVLRLACGLLEPCSGSLQVWGQSLANVNLASLRAHVSMLTQDAYLFPVSIGENIAFGRPSASHAEVVAAAKAASAHEFIVKLDGGYGTPVGELGNRLSGGQRQRICLARAMLKDAPVLLLDEPTAALDSESEAQVLQAIEDLMEDRTTLIVSHRLSTLRDVDCICVLDRGRVCERGRHEDLLQLDGLYRRLYEQQMIVEGPIPAVRGVKP